MLKLFGSVGVLCSSLGRGVKLSTPLFSSYQDYRKFEKQSVWVYSNRKKKGLPTRHKISFNVLTQNRNVLKSKCATFANFIHQKDALVSITMVNKFFSQYSEKPMYTVHDCFVSNHEISEKLADLYKDSLFESLGDPISLINLFVSKNLIEPFYPHYLRTDSTNQTIEEFKIHNSIEEYIYLRYHFCGDPIPVEHFHFFIGKWKEIVLETLGSKKALIFEKRFNEFIEYYNNYVLSLCGKIIERVHGNSHYVEEILYQRKEIDKRKRNFRYICYSRIMGKKNYSLT